MMDFGKDIGNKLKESGIGLFGGCIIILILLVIIMLINGALIYMIWNWLAIELFTGLAPYALTYWQSCGVGIVLTALGSFFRSK